MAEKHEDYQDIVNVARSLVSLISRGRHLPDPTVSSPAASLPEGRTVQSDITTSMQSLVRHEPSPATVVHTAPRTAMQSEMQRAFPGFFRRESIRGKKHTSGVGKNILPVAIRSVRLQFFLLPGPTDRTPKSSLDIDFLQAGLGRRTVALPENACHSEIQKALEEHYPKIKSLSGGWLLYKASGGGGQRKLSAVATDTEGYNAHLLKTVSVNGRNVLYIIPLQEELSCSPLPVDSPEFENMPKSNCKTCGMTMPVQFLPMHIKTCITVEENENDEPDVFVVSETVSAQQPEKGPMEQCPICGMNFDHETISFHASTCGDGMLSDPGPSLVDENPLEGSSGFSFPTMRTDRVGTSALHVTEEQEWKAIADPGKAAEAFRMTITSAQATEKPLRFCMDIHQDPMEREMAIIRFYKNSREKWASPLHCVLEGDPATGDGVNRHFISMSMEMLKNGININYGNGAVTLLFEGQSNHKIPCASQQLLDSDLFIMAGRMVGHSFLHGGPGLAGLSPAIVHLLSGGVAETCTITLEDCPDLEQRAAIEALNGEDELTQEQKSAVTTLTEMWDLPKVTADNRLYLFQRLLQHAVLGRTTMQIKQMRKGLKETGVWEVLVNRKDIVDIMFPREDQFICSPEVLMHQIIWPNCQNDDGDDDEECPLPTRCRISGYFRRFIVTTSSDNLLGLLKFWTGWEVPTGPLKVEVVQRDLPRSQTCFQSIRLPGLCSTYEEFEDAMLASISSNDTGFGVI